MGLRPRSTFHLEEPVEGYYRRTQVRHTHSDFVVLSLLLDLEERTFLPVSPFICFNVPIKMSETTTPTMTVYRSDYSTLTYQLTL